MITAMVLCNHIGVTIFPSIILLNCLPNRIWIWMDSKWFVPLDLKQYNIAMLVFLVLGYCSSGTFLKHVLWVLQSKPFPSYFTSLLDMCSSNWWENLIFTKTTQKLFYDEVKHFKQLSQEIEEKYIYFRTLIS